MTKYILIKTDENPIVLMDCKHCMYDPADGKCKRFVGEAQLLDKKLGEMLWKK